MRIETITIQNGPAKQKSRLTGTIHLSSEEESRTNWMTILVGNNGCGKSLVLRLLAEGGLGLSRYSGHGQGSVNFSMRLSGGTPPSKVIALSGTPLDRFPRGGAREVLTNRVSGAYDWPAYIYLGQRSANGMAGAMESQRALAALYLKNARELKGREHALQAALGPIKLSPEIGFRAQVSFSIRNSVRKEGLNPTEAVDNHLERAQRALDRLGPASTQWEAETRFFAELVREPSSELRRTLIESVSAIKARDVAFILGPNVQEFKIGFKNIVDWQCAIRLGFFEIDALEFRGIDDRGATTFRDSDLSSGQWNWITTLVGLALEIENDALVLIDEPENSLHPEWQRNYVACVGEMLDAFNGCHVFAATHSALVASGLAPEKGQVMHLQKVSAQNDRFELITTNISSAFGWSAQDVYDEVFRVTSTRSPEFIDRANRALELISSGTDPRNEGLVAIVRGLVEDAQILPSHDPMRQVVISMQSHIDGVGNAATAAM